MRSHTVSRAQYWKKHADIIHRYIMEHGWDEERKTFVSAMDGTNPVRSEVVGRLGLMFLEGR